MLIALNLHCHTTFQESIMPNHATPKSVCFRTLKITILNLENVSKQKAFYVLTCISLITRKGEFFHIFKFFFSE